MIDPKEFGFPWRGFNHGWKREDLDIDPQQGIVVFWGLLNNLKLHDELDRQKPPLERLDEFPFQDRVIKPRLYDTRCASFDGKQKRLLKSLAATDFSDLEVPPRPSSVPKVRSTA